MNIITQIREKAKAARKRIVLPESDDPRVLKAARFLHENEICEVVLLNAGEAEDLPAGIESINISGSDALKEYAAAFYEKRKHRGLTEEQALETVKNPLFYGASMVAAGKADGMVAGSVATTGNVLRAAIQVVGLKKGSSVVSSTFLMSFEDGRNFTFADCAVVPYPDAEQLASIALDSAETHRKVTGEEPLAAMLSFSTKGSAEHESVSLVREALAAASAKNKNLKIDGELQFDAAIIEDIAAVKAPGSPVAGKANVFIFPNLDAGNIAYKITERLAGAAATGPIIQGLDRPVLDLSRGCSWQDIVNTVSVCTLMS